MSRAGMMVLFRAQLASVEAEIRAKKAELESLRLAQEAAEAKIEELHHHKEKLVQESEATEDGAEK
ncbi:MAG: hypothetical protein RIC14_06725 [Filomicrobium sp.]